MLDTKSTFDRLVTAQRRRSHEQAQRILDNRFYRNVSGALGGTQEYMAMEKLHELHDEGGFDLIVVDTPPTRHALDFLDAPQRLLRLLDNRDLPPADDADARRTCASRASRCRRSCARSSRVVGSEVDRRRRRVLPRVRRHGGGLPRAGRDGRASSSPSPTTAFVLVTSPRRDAMEEAGSSPSGSATTTRRSTRSS